jgi:hypothetical protein
VKPPDWSREFDKPIPAPDGRELVTLKDARTYITELPKAEHKAPEWQAAVQAPLLVATPISMPITAIAVLDV